MKKTGVVTIIGKPNVGKSSLINSILERKLSIISNVVGTTKLTIGDIYEDEEARFLILDTPGIIKPLDLLGKIERREALKTINDSDVILFITDLNFSKKDTEILEKIKNHENVICVLNKIDLINKTELILHLLMLQEFNFEEIIPISVLKSENIDELISIIKEKLPNEEKPLQEFYFTRSQFISEAIRESVISNLQEELPHLIYVKVYEIDDNEKTIYTTIILERENHKKMIIGKKGKLIRKIIKESTMKIAEILNDNYKLEINIKVWPNWRNDERALEELNIL